MLGGRRSVVCPPARPVARTDARPAGSSGGSSGTVDWADAEQVKRPLTLGGMIGLLSI